MKKVFEIPSIELESLQVSEAVMNEYWGDNPFELASFPGNE